MLKMDISRMQYRPSNPIWMISLSGLAPSFFSFATRYTAAMSMRRPWPKSPNMTANRKGKVTMVNTVGFTSRYRATPYASTMPWNTTVILLVLKYVGGISLVASGWKMVPTCAELARLARNRASWICALPLTGHQPSATRHLRVTSMENMLSVWYTAFSRRTSVSHCSCWNPMDDSVPSRCRTDASRVECSSVRRAVTSAFIWRWREKSSGNG
mmetsp:Transcript_733/g.1692  ORF Transcript_733/g.1692 Transcript_733/m.1692 type:complete len:213 (-) Transcript_733:324-962(-)